MKTKIVSALKTEYANMGLSERAIDGVASFLEKTVTEESGINDAIRAEGVKNLLKSFQGDADYARTRYATLQKELDDYKKAHPSSDPKDDKTEPDSKYDAVLEEIKALKADLAEKNKVAARRELLASVEAKMKEETSNPSVLKLALKEIEIEDSDTVESLVGKIKPKYDSLYTELYGQSPVPPVGAPGAPQYQKGDDGAYIEHLRAEGKLPKSE